MPKINLIGIIICFFGIIYIVRLIQKGDLKERYALAWLGSALGAIVCAISIDSVEYIAHKINVAVPLNLLLFVAILFLAGISLVLSVAISTQTKRIEILAKEVSLLQAGQKRK